MKILSPLTDDVNIKIKNNYQKNNQDHGPMVVLWGSRYQDHPEILSQPVVIWHPALYNMSAGMRIFRSKFTRLSKILRRG